MEQIVTWLAPLATTIAALITASNLGSRITGYGFAIFTVGSIAWAAQGYFTDQSNLVWQNAILTLLNLFGVWRWLGFRAEVEEGGQAAQEESRLTPGEELFPVSLLTSAPLLGQCGERLGNAVDAMAGCNSGRVSYVVVGKGGVAGVGETFRRIDWPSVRADGQQLRCDLDGAAFDRLDKLPHDEWPGQ